MIQIFAVDENTGKFIEEETLTITFKRQGGGYYLPTKPHALVVSMIGKGVVRCEEESSKEVVGAGEVIEVRRSEEGDSNSGTEADGDGGREG